MLKRSTLILFIFLLHLTLIGQTRFYGVSDIGGPLQDNIFYHFKEGDSVATIDYKLPEFQGMHPTGGPLFHNGVMYGLSQEGSDNGKGSLWSYDDSRDPKTEVLHSFGSNSDGFPIGTPVVVDDVIYGVTERLNSPFHADATIFSYDLLVKAYTKKADFVGVGGSSGWTTGGLTVDSNKLWGLAYIPSSSNDKGIIYYYDLDLDTLVIAHTNPPSGPFEKPVGELVRHDSLFYGISNLGGNHDDGILFSYDPIADTLIKLKDLNFNTVGGNPEAGVFLHNGELFFHCLGGTFGSFSNAAGTLLRYNIQSGVLTKLVDFDNTTGTAPYSKPFVDSGFVYGTTGDFPGAAGVVYKFNISNSNYSILEELSIRDGRVMNNEFIESERKIYSFTAHKDVNGTLHFDPGSVFRVDLNAGTFEHIFVMSRHPFGLPIAQAAYYENAIYGWGAGGRYEDGVIYKYTPATDEYKVLHQLNVISPLGSSAREVKVHDGSLYFNYSRDNFNGFKHSLVRYDIAGDSAETILSNHTFSFANINIIEDELWAIRYQLNPTAYGIIRMDINNIGGSIQQAYTWSGTVNGFRPNRDVAIFEDQLYGTTGRGGTNDNGVIYALDTASHGFTKLHDFTTGVLGVNPTRAFSIYDSVVYGSTANGGTYNEGVLWDFNLKDSTYSKIGEFDITTNGESLHGLTFRDSVLYGANKFGIDGGLIWRYDLTSASWLKEIMLDSASIGQPRWQFISFESPILLTGRDITVFLDSTGQSTINVEDVDRGSTALNDSLLLSLSDTLFNCDDSSKTSTWLIGDNQQGQLDSLLIEITVIDTISPWFINPLDTLYLDSLGQLTIDSASLSGMINDNCKIISASISHDSLSCDSIGNRLIEVMALDMNGNELLFSDLVYISDSIAPTILGRDLTIYLDNTGSVSITAAMLDSASSDVCGISSFTASQTSFDCTHTGSNTITFTVTDAGNNSTSTSQIITVLDTIAPSLGCVNRIACTDKPLNYPLPFHSDNCSSSLTHLSGPMPQDTVSHGTYTVRYKVSDASGNVDSCAFEIAVANTQKPDLGNDTVISSGATVTLDPGPGFASTIWSTGDTSQILTLTFTSPTEVIVTTEDINGCTANDTIFIDILVGIKEHDETTWSVFPNPVQEKLWIRNDELPLPYELRNIKGLVVRKGLIQHGTTHINVSSLSPGVYNLITERGVKMVIKAK